MTDPHTTLTAGEIAAEVGQPAGRRKQPQQPLVDPKLRAVGQRLDQVVAAARVTRCPSCESRSLDHCPFGGTKGVDCAAVKSGLAHLWSAVRQVDEAVAAAGLQREETKL